MKEIGGLERFGAKTTNRNRRSVECERRNDCVHARAVGEACVNHRSGFVDMSSERRDYSFDDQSKLLFVAKGFSAELDLAVSLDINVLRTVDHDLRDVRPAQ